MNSLMFRFMGDASSFNNAAQQVHGGLTGVTGKAKMIAGAVTGVFSSLAGMKSIGLAAGFEDTNIAFETLLGSASETKKLLNDLTVFAAKTPFQMPEIQGAARGLATFGERGDSLMKTLKVLGDVTAGTGKSFGEISMVFNQIRGKGKLQMEEFYQLSERGAISMQDIADHVGGGLAGATDAISKGRVKFEDVRQIFEKLTGEGGRFHNMTEKMSTSFNGLSSTLSDNVNIEFRKLGTELLPMAKIGVKALIDLLEWFGSLPQGIKVAGAAVTGLVSGLTALTAGVIYLGPIFAAVFSPLLPLIIGVTAGIGMLVASMGGFGNTWDWLIDVTGKWYDTARGFIANFEENLQILKDYLLILFDPLIQGATTAYDAVMSTFSSMASVVGEFVSTAFGFFVNLQENVGNVFGWIGDNWMNVVTDAGAILITFVTNGISNIQTFAMTAMELLGLFGGWFYDNIPAIGQTILNFIDAAIDNFFTLADTIANVFREVTGVISEAFSKIFSGDFSGAASSFASLGSKIGQAVAEGVGNLRTGAVETSSLPTGEAAAVLANGLLQLKGPLEGFESTTKDGLKLNFNTEGLLDGVLPKFNLELPKDEDEEGDGGDGAGGGGADRSKKEFQQTSFRRFGLPSVLASSAPLQKQKVQDELVAGEVRKLGEVFKNTRPLAVAGE